MIRPLRSLFASLSPLTNIFGLEACQLDEEEEPGSVLRTMNRLWKSDRRRSLTNSGLFFFSVPRA